MRRREFPMSLDPQAEKPLFVQISQALAADIARGRLRPGDAVPGTRTLAESLGVHRSTVVAAYAELAAQGWVATKPGGATYVAAASPDPKPRRFAPKLSPLALASRVPAPGYPIEPAPIQTHALPELPRGALVMWGGSPDLRLAPIEALSRAYRRVTRRRGKTLLAYSPHFAGHPDLREAVARLVSSARGLADDASSVLITRGSQMALDLLARSLIAPGDVVAVEALGYPNAVNVFRRAGAKVVPIAVDRHGLVVADLVALSRQTRVRLVYVTPHHQYPTTVTLSPTRRLALLEHARREHLAIIEDDYDQEFHYDGRPVLPLASNDPHGNVIYVGTFAKSLAPGLRLAFVVGPHALLERLSAERALVDRQGDAILECAVAELLEDGELQRHVRRMRRVYHARRDAFCEALDRTLGHVLSYRRPPGGLQLWADAAPGLSLERWQERAREQGVFFQIGRQFTLDGAPVQSVRLGYATLDEKESALALARLAECLPASRRSSKAR
ncbi:MAG TPA: PLP-dependent aminotransferase family protein [Polyangiaceae bacterium]|nr:PLP-dependent aminotransferase family protein [Polyangiaceae bacterium]